MGTGNSGLRTVLIWALLSVAYRPVWAQDAQPPSFRSAVERVPVDVSVLDASGRPINDLTLDDFIVRVDGRPRTVASADFIRAGRLRDETPAPEWFSSNAGQRPGRLVAIVIDEAHVRRGASRQVFQAAARFVRSLDRADRVGVFLIPGTGPLTGFTSNHALVARLLDGASGMNTEADISGRVGIAEAFELLDRPPDPNSPTLGPPGSLLEEVFSRECAGENDTNSIAACRRRIEGEARNVFTLTRGRTTRSLTALRGLLEEFAQTPDSKTVVLLSEGVVLGRDMTDISWMRPLAARAQISLYALRLDSELFDAGIGRVSPSRRADLDLLHAGLDQLVGAANGTVMPVAVNAGALFERLDVELSGYYLLGLEPVATDRDGRTHSISVDVRRPSVRVRARREFSLAAERPATRAEQLASALRAPTLQTDFTVQASTWSFPEGPGSRQVKALLAVTLDRAFNPEGPFGIAWTLHDASGRLVTAQDESTVSRAPGVAAGTPQTWADAVVVPPGVYTLKVAAVDDSGRRATVEHAFEARVAGFDQVRMSDVLVAAPAVTGATSSPSVDGTITTASLVGYVELAADRPESLGPITLVLEIARDEDSPALEVTPMRFTDDGSGAQRRADGALGVAHLPDGAYVVRARLHSNGRPIRAVSRPVIISRPVPASGAELTPASAVGALAPPPLDRALLLNRTAVGFMLDQLAQGNHPPLPDALLPALGLTRIGRFTQAAEIATAATTTHFAAPFFRGLAALAAGTLDDAVTQFAASLAAAPDFLPATFYLGACYAAAGRDRDALLAWRTGLIADDRAPWVYTTVIDSALRAQDVRFALQLSTDGLTRWPALPAMRTRVAISYARVGQPVQALQVLLPAMDASDADAATVFLGLQLLHQAATLGVSLGSTRADDVALFDRWAARYAAAGGRDGDTVATWRRQVAGR